MKTYSPKKSEIKRKWYLINAQGKTVGKVAVEAATILYGKHKPLFVPHLDCGDYVVIINAKDVVLTGKKWDQKKYFHHTPYMGHYKLTPARQVLEEKPTKILEHAIAGMVPKNRLRKEILAKLKIYPGSEHKHQAQNPEVLEI